MTQGSGLPVGEVIDHNGHALQITRLLSDKGLTSRVYEGWFEDEGSEKVHVAIKSMKHLDFPMARKAFIEEGGTLASVMHYEKLANQDQRINLSVTPAYFGSGEYQDVPYLVMEFVSGTEIPKLIEQKGGKLGEEQALTVGWHLFRTLDILHSKLKKTYADLKYENLWWVQTDDEGGEGQLKMMDFGTMEEMPENEQVPKGVRRDILQGGIYLCHMITGQMPNYSMAGFLKERAEPIIRNADMSWGSREVLFKLLHRNPQARPTEAVSVISDLRTLVNFWNRPIKDVMGIAQQLLAKGEAEEKAAKAHDHAFRARAALDIIKRRDPEVDKIDDDINRAEKLLSISNYLERGKTLLTTRSADLARGIFEEGMHWSNEPGTLRRWAYLARVGEEITPTVFDEYLPAAMEMVEWMNKGDSQHALERLNELKPHLSSKGLDILFADIKLFENINAAQAAVTGVQKDYLEAAKYYREAMSWMEKLPDKAFIREEEEGDLFLLAREMELRHETEGVSRQRFAEAKQILEGAEPDHELALSKVENAVDLDPENVATLNDLEELIKLSLKANRFALAYQIAGIGLKKGVEHPSLLSFFQLARQLKEGEQALIAGRQSDHLAILREVRTSFPPDIAEADLINYLRDHAAQKAIDTKDGEWLNKMAQFAQEQNDWEKAKQWQSDADRLLGQREVTVRQAIDRLASDITCLLQMDEFSTDKAGEVSKRFTATEITALANQKNFRLERIERMVSDVEQLVKEIDHRREDVAGFRSRINTLLEAQTQEQAELKGFIEDQRQARLDVLDRLWGRLKTFMAWGRKADSAGARSEIFNQIAKQAEDEAVELIRQCQFYLASIDQSNAHVKNLLNEIYLTIDKLGMKSWQTLSKLADERVENVQQAFSKAQQAFMKGELNQVMNEIDILAPDYFLAPEWINLKTRLTQINMFKSWRESNKSELQSGKLSPETLTRMRSYLLLGLPSIYYQDLHNDLQTAYQNARQHVEAELNDPRSTEFLKAVRYWANVDLTSKMLDTKRQSSI